MTDNRPLEILAREINPAHDLDRITYNERGLTFNPFVVVLHFIKHPVRGALVGGVTGSLASYLSGGSPQDGFVSGSRIGACLDLGQYIVRLTYKVIRVEVPASYRHIIKLFRED